MTTGLIDRASVTIPAPAADVWEALVTPAAIKTYMFGATVTSDSVVGSPIAWTGEWQSRACEDKGIILQIVRERVLEFSYFSPLAGAADLPENYHIVTVHLSSDGAQQTLRRASNVLDVRGVIPCQVTVRPSRAPNPRVRSDPEGDPRVC